MRVAVLGLGSAGSRHADLAAELGHRVVGYDPNQARGSGVPRVASEHEAIAAADAVIVATPSGLHASQATRALEAGRHVLVEKPLATDAEDAERVAEAAMRAGTVCGIAMNLRFHPGLVALKRLLGEGRLGPALLARASFGYDLRLWRPEADYRSSYSARDDLGGGILLDAIHELDYLVWLLGPVSSVTGETAHLSTLEIDVEDVGVAALRFTSGALASVDLNFFEPAYRRGCLVVGERAAATWDWTAATVIVRDRAGSQDRLEVGCELRDLYRDELTDFLLAADTGGVARTSVLEGVEVLRIADAVKESSAQGRRITLAPMTRRGQQ